MRHPWRPLRSLVLLAACGSVLGGFGTVRAAGVAALTVTVSGIKPGGVIPRAFGRGGWSLHTESRCRQDPGGQVALT